MNGNDQITVDTKYNWEFSCSDYDYMYRAEMANGISLIVCRYSDSDNWYAFSVLFGKISRLEDFKSDTVNELILKLENH